MSRASIQHIADLAGVSKMTVSRVLRGEGGSRYQEQILEAARRLDYIPVRPTLQNRRVKTNVIGVLEEGHFLFESEIGSQTFRGVAPTALNNGYDVLMLRPQQHQPVEQRKLQFLDRRCDGFIFIVSGENREILELLVQNEMPAVACYTDDVPEGISWVTPDNEQAIRDAVALLVSKGHRNIIYWSGPQGHSDARERTKAFTKAMREADLPLYQENYIWDNEDDKKQGIEGLPALSDSDSFHDLISNHMTAVICHNDQRAITIWDEVVEMGFRVPEDLSIIGIDNSPEAQERSLTTLYNPFIEIGRAAADVLHSLINGGAAEDNCQRMPMPLIERASTGPAKQPLS
ncbi:LacI family transcriptional regulator [bacterium]|nr:MAG: LacI family transcriptional regulator [bacterium]